MSLFNHSVPLWDYWCNMMTCIKCVWNLRIIYGWWFPLQLGVVLVYWYPSAHNQCTLQWTYLELHNAISRTSARDLITCWDHHNIWRLSIARHNRCWSSAFSVWIKDHVGKKKNQCRNNGNENTSTAPLCRGNRRPQTNQTFYTLDV